MNTLENIAKSGKKNEVKNEAKELSHVEIFAALNPAQQVKLLTLHNKVHRLACERGRIDAANKAAGLSSDVSKPDTKNAVGFTGTVNKNAMISKDQNKTLQEIQRLNSAFNFCGLSQAV